MTIKQFACAAIFAATAATASAAPVDQYASTVIDFSSQWSNPAWAAFQTLGAPDTFAYGDISTAWAPGPRDGTLEFITLGFATPVYADGVTIRETYGNGFVYQVDFLDTLDVLHTIFSGTDSSLPGSPVDFLVTTSPSSYLVKGVKIYTDTDHDHVAWEEIDSVQLHGDTVYTGSVPDTASALPLLAFSAAGILALSRRRNKA